MKWISVKDRLPEKDDIIAVITKFYDEDEQSYYVYDAGKIISLDDGTLVYENGCCSFDRFKFDYWMPLPEGPKE